VPCRCFLFADRRLGSQARQVKIEAAGGCLPPGSGRLSKIFDQDLSGLDDCRPRAAPELVPDARPEHQRKAHHIQPVSGIVALLAAEDHRGCGKIGKATGGPAQLAEADMKAPAALSIRGLGRHRQPPCLPPQGEALGDSKRFAVDFVIGATDARRSRHLFTPSYSERHALHLRLPSR